MSSEVDTLDRVADTEPGTDRTIRVALGRRVEVIGDLLLPPEPTDSSRAACRDIGRRLEEWQGPGIVVLCGRLVAPGCPSEVGPSSVLSAHRGSPGGPADLRRTAGLAGRRGDGRRRA